MKLDKGLQAFVEQAGDRLDEVITGAAQHYDKMSKMLVSTTEGIAYMYSVVDEMQEKEGIAEKTTCSGSCNFCCYEDVKVSNDELEYAAHYIKENNIKLDPKRVEKYLAKPYHKQKYADKACVMLDKEGNCSIYHARPFICRLFNSTDTPSKCDTSKGTVSTNTVRVVEAYGVMMGVVKAQKSQELKTFKSIL